jgi:hypothetical protein
MDPAVVRVASGARKNKRVGKTEVMYLRIKYAVGITRGSGCRAVIIANPIPLDGVAGSNGNGAGTEDGAT